MRGRHHRDPNMPPTTAPCPFAPLMQLSQKRSADGDEISWACCILEARICNPCSYQVKPLAFIRRRLRRRGDDRHPRG